MTQFINRDRNGERMPWPQEEPEMWPQQFEQEQEVAQELDDLKQALRKYGRHAEDCHTQDRPTRPQGQKIPECTCGWGEVERGL